MATRKKTSSKSRTKKVASKRTATRKPAKKKAAKKKPTVKKRKSTVRKKAVGSKKKVARKKKATTTKKATRKKVSKKAAAKKKVVKKPAAKKKAAAKKKTARKKTTGKATARKKAATKKRTTRKAATRKASRKKSPGRKIKRRLGTAPEDVPAIGPVAGIEPYKLRAREKYMSKRQLKHFEFILKAWKSELMAEANRTVHHMKDEAANFPDPNDRATQESEFSLELRTRDRERKLIKKIDEAIATVESHDYGYCESCGVEIGVRRLEARPTATLCIDCKTLDEIREKQMRT